MKRTVGLLALLLAGAVVAVGCGGKLLAAPNGVAGAGGALGAAAEQAGATERIAEAQAILERVAAFYRTLPGFSGEETITGNVSGLGRIPASTRKFIFVRPNKLVIRKSGTQELGYYSDGKTVTQTDGANKLYMKMKAPADYQSPDDMLVRVVDVDGLFGNEPFKFPKGEITDARISKTKAAASTGGGKPFVTVTLQTKTPGRQRMIYQFEDSNTPFVLNRSQLGSMDRRTVTSKISFANWAIEKKADPKVFAAVIPPGFKELTEEMLARGDNPLIGKPAPDFTLKTLDGKTVSLASFKGKSAVVMDFWATWCPPCRRTFPAFAGMSAANKGRIAFIGVLVHDDPKNAKDFLEKNRLDVNVAIDDETVAKKYLINGIPTTVMIDKKGIVRAVPPISDDYETKVTKLLKGL